MRRVTLSFDNGPDPDVTPHVLDLLRERELRAHFYVLGKHLATPAGRRLVERARDEGHLIGNHSYTHETPLGADPRPDAVAQEIVRTEALLAPLVPGPRRFRPFGGGGLLGRHLLSPAARDYLVAHGYSCILWNAVPRDWDDPGWVSTALAQTAARDHAVVVLHDVPSACLDGLPAFLDALLARGDDLTQDLPPECVPIASGRITANLSEIVNA
ncbi:polysaccharide deacetylase family protein [Chondromyces apiculatus]|uniref:Polysaccharide deacetylase n=1 Tax=Chondromyces apiculatus DSM 436 TaxID=1192034 RepID=A0A017T8E2_9BACT|nr:polysaccharide deacetylase family protein [Chondromyces apiculatus]EYF05247.1 Polysaccharide deacetylase [Chondromyces apiculatus DSM 436]